MIQRRGTYGALLLVLATTALVGAQPRPVLPAPVPVPTPMPPTPTPGPDAAVRLAADQLYVVDSPTDSVLILHPAKFVRLSEEKGPVKIRGKFAGSTGLTETKTFNGPFVWILEANGTGRVFIDVVPKGFKDRKDIVSGLIDVDDGTAPQPPPVDPVDPVVPKPRPAGSPRVILIYESGDSLTAPQRAVVYGKEVEDWLNANCKDGKAGWRRRDKDAPGEADPTFAALWAAVKPKVRVTPCVAVEVGGKVDLVNLEATPAAMVTVFEKYKGGK